MLQTLVAESNYISYDTTTKNFPSAFWASTDLSVPVVGTPTTTKQGYADYFQFWNEHSQCELRMDFALDDLFGDFKQLLFVRIHNPKPCGRDA